MLQLKVAAVLLKSGQYNQLYSDRSKMPHTPLLVAARMGHNEVIYLLLTHGFDVNRKVDGANGNALHEAILYGKLESVNYLIMVSLK